MGVVENQTSKGLRENGCRVISEGEMGHEAGTPVKELISRLGRSGAGMCHCEH